jgi:hypothetical protein
MMLRLSLLLVVAIAPALPATTTVWQTSGFAGFLPGRLHALSLLPDGTLEPGPSALFTASLNQPVLWSLAPGPSGIIYAATGHEGKLFRISPDGKVSLIWSAPQSEIFAVAVSPNGVVYAATSPNGGVYRMENGSATEIWHAPAKYIWALQVAPSGVIYAATGEAGSIYRIAPDGSATLYYATGQTNVTSLQLASDGALFAGTDPNGLLFEITAPGHSKVVLDSTLPEIRAIALASDQSLYVAAMGGAVTTRGAAAAASSASTGAMIATSPTVITVTASEAEEQTAVRSASPQNPSSAVSPPPAAASGIVELSGVERSAIYHVKPDGAVQKLHTSKDYNIYDLLLDGSSLIFSTDDHGRIYRLGPLGQIALISEPGEGETTRLLPTPVKSGESRAVFYAALSNPARLVALGAPGASTATYESPVHDCSSIAARWGHIQWHGEGSGVVFYTRTGNSARPDATWSAWARPARDPGGDLVTSPLGRFIQYRAEFPPGSNARVDSIEVPYLPQNSAPVIHSITVSSILGTNASKTGAASSASNSPYTVTVTATGDPAAAASGSSATDTVTHLQSTQTQISWQADDPDGDKLVYAVYFRAEDETQWQLIRNHIFENTLLLDPDVFADGRYFFRVVASDAPSNAPQYARRTELISAPVLIDNTPPAVTIAPPRRTSSGFDILVTAEDQISSIHLCEYSLDAGLWQPVEAAAGITDSRREQFRIHLDNLPGEHLLVVRVYDTANNAGLARILLR